MTTSKTVLRFSSAVKAAIPEASAVQAITLPDGYILGIGDEYECTFADTPHVFTVVNRRLTRHADGTSTLVVMLDTPTRPPSTP